MTTLSEPGSKRPISGLEAGLEPPYSGIEVHSPSASGYYDAQGPNSGYYSNPPAEPVVQNGLCPKFCIEKELYLLTLSPKRSIRLEDHIKSHVA
jgi:hypothetical protein